MKEVIKIDNSRRFEFIEKYLIPFSVFGASGFISVLIDTDHGKEILQNGYTITREVLGSREYHILVFIILGIVWLYSLASLYRLFTMVLKEGIKND